MWTIEVAGDASADRETVWAWYEATDEAPSWDPLVRRIEPDGPIAVGSGGRNHPAGGPPVRFRYTEVTRLVSYTEVSSSPGAAFAFTHRLEVRPDGGVHLVHGVEVSGPLAGLYRLLLRRKFERGMAEALDNLVRRVEAGPPPGRQT